jgi:isopentenyl-diphosphate delta-isomerase
MTQSINKRKAQHLKLAKSAQYQFSKDSLLDYGLSYEPAIAATPEDNYSLPQVIGRKSLQHPIWISSMTGGSLESGKINKRLAKLALQFGLGMGLGSCRVIMEQPKTIKDFQLRSVLKNAPFWANLGICELDSYLTDMKQWKKFKTILTELDVDGLFIHINPTQEYLQKKGSILLRSSIEILEDLIKIEPTLPLIVKEVGQGMGPLSLKALSQLPLTGIEFASLGGTNFATIEYARDHSDKRLNNPLYALTKLGHSAKEMVDFWQKLQGENKHLENWHTILSGGRGRDVIADVALFKKLERSQKQHISLGLGFSILEQANKDDKSLANWLENYLKSFYFIYCYTHLT